MAETYHGVEIPEDIWQSWNDPNSSEVSGWRRGVCDALSVSFHEDRPESERLDARAGARDAAEQAAFEEQNKDHPAVQRRIAFRKMMEDNHGTR